MSEPKRIADQPVPGDAEEEKVPAPVAKPVNEQQPKPKEEEKKDPPV